ncbi:hypothetical protein Lalb_Chr09g0320861 [Lupinus albus]|uniref:Uncharacterized protein n=1 Tax=Lupinus albus TaxID=3870 RepID=A0A6A4PXQ6_LUPAL|nr:hypothetical protein Lalb_Chr09g0320861 [Lupinus albus]
MNNKFGNVPATEGTNRNRFRSNRPLPKRGQIKSKIAANAFNSIVYVISRTSYSSSFNFPRKN